MEIETSSGAAPAPGDPGPVRRIPTDAPDVPPADQTALCLSGGGYRAMLFHLGALWRLNELGRLPRLARISSVSGGSIAAGLLGSRWSSLGFDADGVAAHFQQEIVRPLRRLAARTLDWKAVTTGLLLPGTTISERLAAAYRRQLFGSATLQDLPDWPHFVLNATNLQSGVLWRFTKRFSWDYRVGKIERPSFALATAVAASSAFPPVLSPMRLRLSESDFAPNTGTDLQLPPYTTRPALADGGVYDNLGLETAWKRCRTVLISDGGGQMASQAGLWRTWPSQSLRVLKVIDNQVRDLRKRQAIAAFVAGSREGAYWGIRSELANFRTDSPLECPPHATRVLAETPTRLARLAPLTQERLINWGYAICDAALRAHVDRSLTPPDGFPYPEAGVGHAPVRREAMEVP